MTHLCMEQSGYYEDDPSDPMVCQLPEGHPDEHYHCDIGKWNGCGGALTDVDMMLLDPSLIGDHSERGKRY